VFKKECPWCLEKVSFKQLGSRPVEQKPKWYQFSISVQVCPYCAGAVKVGGKGLWFLILAVPSFLSIIIELVFKYNFMAEFNLSSISWTLLALGFGGAYLFTKLEKLKNV